MNVTQYAHGVLVQTNDASVIVSAPLPSFNPKIEDLPANPYAASVSPDAATESDPNKLQAGGESSNLDTSSLVPGAQEGQGVAPVPAADAKPAEVVVDGVKTDAPEVVVQTDGNVVIDAPAVAVEGAVVAEAKPAEETPAEDTPAKTAKTGK